MAEHRGREDPTGTVWSEMGRYAHLGFQLALSTGLFLLVGWWLDGKIGTTPLLTIVGALLGAAAGFYSMIHQLTRKSRDDSRGGPGAPETKH
jgi:F0F1-type ATP synthase assembly protein I